MIGHFADSDIGGIVDHYNCLTFFFITCTFSDFRELHL